LRPFAEAGKLDAAVSLSALALEMREKIAGATTDSAEAVGRLSGFAVAGGVFNGSYLQRGREAGASTRQVNCWAKPDPKP